MTTLKEETAADYVETIKSIFSRNEMLQGQLDHLVRNRLGSATYWFIQGVLITKELQYTRKLSPTQLSEIKSACSIATRTLMTH